MGDYKYEIQERAEEIASQEYDGVEFLALSAAIQSEI